MAITRRKIIYSLLDTVRGGLQGDDEAISEDLVGFWVDNVRAKLIKENLDKGRTLSQNAVQSLGCVEVSQVDASVCCDLKTDCTVLRTDTQIPAPIEISSRDLVTRIGPVGIGDRPYNIIEFERVPWVDTDKFVYAFLRDRHVYIIGPDIMDIEKINIQGVFANPVDVGSYQTCAGDPCYTDDTTYPISEYMVPTLEAIILQNYFKIAAVSPNDQTGNAKADLEPPTQQ